jgi:hypothetical protein
MYAAKKDNQDLRAGQEKSVLLNLHADTICLRNHIMIHP